MYILLVGEGARQSRSIESSKRSTLDVIQNLGYGVICTRVWARLNWDRFVFLKLYRNPALSTMRSKPLASQH
jgi:hypothetical protein